MRKVVYNNCYGGFSLSDKAQELFLEKKGIPYTKIENKWGSYYQTEEDSYDRDIERHDPILVEVVETLGEEANGPCSKLRITEVRFAYRIDEYDGMETVMEPGEYDWVL